jgi:hypothetical protein
MGLPRSSRAVSQRVIANEAVVAAITTTAVETIRFMAEPPQLITDWDLTFPCGFE